MTTTAQQEEIEIQAIDMMERQHVFTILERYPRYMIVKMAVAS